MISSWLDWLNGQSVGYGPRRGQGLLAGQAKRFHVHFYIWSMCTSFMRNRLVRTISTTAIKE